MQSKRLRFPDLTLDFTLGARMLVKYPWLTVVGGFAMAFGIWVGAITFEMVTMLVNPSLPLPGGERIVSIQNWDVRESRVETRALHDYTVWKGALRSVADLGAYRDAMRNLTVTAGDARPVRAVEMSASGFRVAGATPLLGRTLVDADERAGAPPVAVVGFELWQSRFRGDSGVVGRSVQVGETFATIVGVMPEGFAFPVAHELWMPLDVESLDRSPRGGPGISVFGRLADGVAMEEAQTELATIGRRMAQELPLTHASLQPQVAHYTKPFLPSLKGADVVMYYAIPGFAVMLLVLVCGNVALLMFARAATRENELIVRSALGASRGRLITQLFTEALVLGGVAAAVGLAAADFALRRWGGQFLQQNLGQVPFWYDPHLSRVTVLYALGLTLLAALIAGVVPALKVTKGLGSRLRQAGAGGGGLKFGGVWTAVIITQVAVTTAFPALVYVENLQLVRIRNASAGFAAERYLSVRIEPETLSDAEQASTDAGVVAAREALAQRFTGSLQALRPRVAAESDVVGVTFVDWLPRDSHDEYLIAIDDAPGAAESSEPLVANIASVDRHYFDVLQAPVLAGRGFGEADFIADPRAVIVDQAFVDQILQGRNAVGRRVRLVYGWLPTGSEADTAHYWREIVGVVPELGMGAPTDAGRASGLYMPVIPGTRGPTHMVVHTRGDPLSFVPTLRAIATSVDPTLRLSDFQRVDQVTGGMLVMVQLWLRITVLLTAVALLLSLAGIYAVMSFTVARRTREIGIRVALGADARRVVAAVFRRPLTQVGIGVAAGITLVSLLFFALTFCRMGPCGGDAMSASRAVMLVLYALLVLGVCLLACIVPTRRALRVEPTEALRAE